MPHQLQCQLPPPKPPVSLSTAIKIPSLIAQKLLAFCMEQRGEGGGEKRRCREMERWQLGVGGSWPVEGIEK